MRELHFPSAHNNFLACWASESRVKPLTYVLDIKKNNRTPTVLNMPSDLQPTLRRSPLEQYSMASKGRSFSPMELNSAGTSLASTTFTWLSLWLGIVGIHRIIVYQDLDSIIYIYIYHACWPINKATCFFIIWISLLQRSLFFWFNSRRHSFKAILSPVSCSKKYKYQKIQVKNRSIINDCYTTFTLSWRFYPQPTYKWGNQIKQE